MARYTKTFTKSNGETINAAEFNSEFQSIEDSFVDVILSDTAPATASSVGTEGSIAWDENYLYICTATNTWKRVAISTW